jgi:glycerophosphoryl diester phosphodiesterase
MPDGVAITRNGHRTLLKWHRGRKRIADLPFTGERILEGMRLGASVEVDLVKHADGGFAVLHDFSLAHDTTGEGLVKDAPAAALRRLFLRDGQGRPTTHQLMLFEDLCALLAAGEGIAPEALLQLALKEEGRGAIGAREVAAFADAATPVRQHLILSGGSADNVGMLAAATPGLATGYDPCAAPVVARLVVTRAFDRFVADALAAAPEARMIYLAYQLVLYAADQGFDLIGAFHAAGKTVDAWTLDAATPENAARAERLLALNVDQITTDDPEALEALLLRA